jgi:hypothetical protein
MPDAAAQPRPAGQDGREESPTQKVFGVIKQVFVIWAISQLGTRIIQSQFGSKSTTPTSAPSTPGQEQQQSGIPQAQIDPWTLPPQHALPAWTLNQPLAMHVHLSTSPTGDVFSAQQTDGWRHDQDAELPSFVWENIIFGDWNDARSIDLDVKLPESVLLHNGSLWADVFLVKGSASPNPLHPKFDRKAVHHVRKLLTRYLPKAKTRKEKNLLGGNTEAGDGEDEEPQADVIVSHWHQNLTLALVSEAASVPFSQLPPFMLERE